MTFNDNIAFLNVELGNDPGMLRFDSVFHLHGFHDDELLPLVKRVTFVHHEFDDRSLDGRREGNGPIGSQKFILFNNTGL